MPHQETTVYRFGAYEATRVVPPDPEQQKFTGDAMYTIMDRADVTGMSYVGGNIDELRMTDRATGQDFTISRNRWATDVRRSAEGYVLVADIVEKTLRRSPVTIVIS